MLSRPICCGNTRRQSGVSKRKVFERVTRPRGNAAERSEIGLSELILDSYLSKGRGTASFERCTSHEFCTQILALEFQWVSRCRNQLQKWARDIRRRGEDRAAFPLVATSREKAASRLRGRPPPVLFLGRKVVYPTSPQNLGANVFSPSPSRAAAICQEGSFGDMSGLEKRRYLTLRQNWAHSKSKKKSSFSA
jgi:hypothetical protein